MKFNKVFKTLQNLSKVPVRPVDIAAALGVSRSNINYKRDKDVELTESDIKKLEKFKPNILVGQPSVLIELVKKKVSMIVLWLLPMII